MANEKKIKKFLSEWAVTYDEDYPNKLTNFKYRLSVMSDSEFKQYAKALKKANRYFGFKNKSYDRVVVATHDRLADIAQELTGQLGALMFDYLAWDLFSSPDQLASMEEAVRMLEHRSEYEGALTMCTVKAVMKCSSDFDDDMDDFWEVYDDVAADQRWNIYFTTERLILQNKRNNERLIRDHIQKSH